MLDNKGDMWIICVVRENGIQVVRRKKMKEQLGLYVHIPFCERKCKYCDFLSGPSSVQNKKAYIDALKKEIEQCKGYDEKYEVVSIFFGGGTPSSIDAEDLAAVLDKLCEVFKIEDCDRIEITTEANPGTLTKEKLEVYKKGGFNRLSLGLQSTHNEELKMLGRIHTYEEFLENYKMAKEAGFTNINIDLMSALPNQTKEGYRQTLERVLALKPSHISAYSLIIEEGTPFYEVYGEDKELEHTLPDEEADREMYHMTKQLLKEAGYDRYEISNYALDGKECIHNKLYWTGKAYLGFGVGASSYIEGVRYRNEEDLSEYMNYINKKKDIKRDVTKLSQNEKMEEFMFLGLRLIQGVSKQAFETQFGVSVEEVYKDVLKKHEQEGLLINGKERIYLTEPGLDVSSYVMSDFLLE